MTRISNNYLSFLSSLVRNSDPSSPDLVKGGSFYKVSCLTHIWGKHQDVQFPASQYWIFRDCWTEEEHLYSQSCLDFHIIETASCWWNQQAVKKKKKKNPGTFQTPLALDSISFLQELGEGLGVTRRLRPRSRVSHCRPKPPSWQDGDGRAIWGQLCWILALGGGGGGSCFPQPGLGKQSHFCPKQIN